MTAYSHYPRTSQQQRARAVYRTLRGKRPMVGLIAAELGIFALLALIVAGVIGLRAIANVAW